MKDFIAAIAIIAFIVGLAFGFVWLIELSKEKRRVICEESPRLCISRNGLKCFDAGGLYYPGGVLSASNCVFPPK